MLVIESKILDYDVDGAIRTSLLEKLQDQEFTPLIRSARLHLYELALSGAESRAREMERALAVRAEVEGDAPYVRGDLFCVEDYAHFLLFKDVAGEGVRAGIIYESELLEPQDKLDAFCRAVKAALESARGGRSETGNGREVDVALPLLVGESLKHEPRAAESIQRFAAALDAPPAGDARGEMAEGWSRTSGLLEDAAARGILQRLSEAHREGRAGGGGALLAADGEGVPDALLSKLAEAGLLKREILVSCRKDGRALFRLPSPDAFAILSESNAICSECGASVADEKAEEINVPTPLSATLLQDGAWLATHLRSMLAKLGIAEREIASRLIPDESEAQLMANICGEPFLFILRDSDWTTAHTRRALDLHAKIESSHLVLISTGKFHDEVPQRLREHARRRTQGGRELKLIIIEGMEKVAAELRPAFEKVAAQALSTELWELDTSLGVNAGQLIAARFQLMQRPGALRDLATAAATSLSGSLREF